jgi:plastocyanin
VGKIRWPRRDEPTSEEQRKIFTSPEEVAMVRPVIRPRRILAIGAATGAAAVALALTTSVVLASLASVRMIERNERYAFDPATIYVHVGNAVVWTNGTDAPHTVTSDSGTELDSPQLSEGQTFEHTFTTAGTFSYHCQIHPYMKARVVVLAPGATPPATATAGLDPQRGLPGGWLWVVVGFGALALVSAALARRLSGRDGRR